MEIRVKDSRKAGCCNYCDRGELRADGMGLIFPYDEVIVVRGVGIETRFCRDCFVKLADFKNYI